MIDWLELSPLLAWVVIENQLWTPFTKYAKVLPKMIGIQVRELKGEDSECQRFYQIGSDVSSQKWGVESVPVMLLILLQKVYFCVLLLLPADTWFLIRWTWISGSPRSIQAFSGDRNSNMGLPYFEVSSFFKEAAIGFQHRRPADVYCWWTASPWLSKPIR